MVELFVIIMTAIVFIYSKIAQVAIITFWCEYTITVIIPTMAFIYKNRNTIGFYGLYFFASLLIFQINILDALKNFLDNILNSL